MHLPSTALHIQSRTLNVSVHPLPPSLTHHSNKPHIMAIELAPIPLPPTADAEKFKDFGREVKGVKPGELSEEELKEVHNLLYKVRSLCDLWASYLSDMHVNSTVCSSSGT